MKESGLNEMSWQQDDMAKELLRRKVMRENMEKPHPDAATRGNERKWWVHQLSDSLEKAKSSLTAASKFKE